MTENQYLNWENVNMVWESVDMTWEEVYILIEVGGIIKRGGSNGYIDYVNGNPWDKTRQEIGEEKTDKFIKLFCRINGLDYEKAIEPNSEIKVTVEQVQKVFNEGLKVGIKID